MIVPGAVLVLLALRDVFHTLFHPGDHGALSARVCALLWAAGSRIGRQGQVLAGPLAVMVTIFLWIGMLVTGFALVYLPLLPTGATYGHGVPSAGGLEAAVYLSSVALATLGLGDIVLTQPWVRLLTPLQGVARLRGPHRCHRLDQPDLPRAGAASVPRGRRGFGPAGRAA